MSISVRMAVSMAIGIVIVMVLIFLIQNQTTEAGTFLKGLLP